MRFLVVLMIWTLSLCGPLRPAIAQQPQGAEDREAEQPAAASLPFDYKIETYRDQEEGAMAFSLQLEQPFLAGEFEKNNFLRLRAKDDQAYLIYPKQTTFQQKHAEFYGRLRGSGQATLQLSYEVVTEQLDGSPQFDRHQAEITVEIPTEPVGIRETYEQWAGEQNDYFAELLRYYPEQTFFEYVLLQSKDRYGVAPPADFQRYMQQRSSDPEQDLYAIFSGGLAIQQTMQRQNLREGAKVGELTQHISSLEPPRVASPDYRLLLQDKREQGKEASPMEIAKLIPEDQYFLHCNTVEAAGRLVELTQDWGDGLLRLFTLSAQNHHLQEKYETQLGLRLSQLKQLAEQGTLTEMAVTGSDFYFPEGTDVTIVLRAKQQDQLLQAIEQTCQTIRQQYPEMTKREFHYRGYQITARYTPERTISSLLVQHGDYVIVSNSHVALRKIIDTVTGEAKPLYDAHDYQYLSMLAPPETEPQAAYFYASDAFIRRLISPRFKIAEKRRRQAFNNLVMLNNASLFYRLENNRSPNSLNDLVEGRFIEYEEILDPTGGAYTFDADQDTTSSSIYNRIKLLTPIIELDVLKVSAEEREQYQRYRQRYESFWGTAFDPIAMRLSLSEPVRLETTLLPLANSGIYRQMRDWLDQPPRKLGTETIAAEAVTSLAAVPGRQRIGDVLRTIPGVKETLQGDPTLTDLDWLGDRVSLHFQDDQTILEIDPSQLQTIQGPFRIGTTQQLVGAAAIAAVNLPVYAAVEVKDTEKASRFLDQLSSRIFLEQNSLLGLPTSLDAYQLPPYRDQRVYALTYKIHAAKIRLFSSLAGNQLLVATELQTLQQAIDAADATESGHEAHAMFRINVQAMQELKKDLRFYWNEKLRQAAHSNIMPIFILMKLYSIPIDEVNELADAKYGVTYFCPGGGEYRYDRQTDQVYSTVYGNRREARQPLTIAEETAFSRLTENIKDIVAWLRFSEDGLVATVEINRLQHDESGPSDDAL